MKPLAARDWGLAAAAGALFLDQASKFLLLYGFGFRGMTTDQSVPVLPFFNLVMAWNPGISYGLFPAHSRLGTGLLIAFSLVAVAGMGWWLWRAGRLGLAVGLGLVIGGAIGNLVDRMVYGEVADFFHFYAAGYDWYVFNLADCAITLGVAALVYDAIFRPETARDANGQAGASDEVS